jgi:hypothetical protein
MNLILKDEIIEKNINKKTWKIKKKQTKRMQIKLERKTSKEDELWEKLK